MDSCLQYFFYLPVMELFVSIRKSMLLAIWKWIPSDQRFVLHLCMPLASPQWQCLSWKSRKLFRICCWVVYETTKLIYFSNDFKAESSTEFGLPTMIYSTSGPCSSIRVPPPMLIIFFSLSMSGTLKPHNQICWCEILIQWKFQLRNCQKACTYRTSIQTTFRIFHQTNVDVIECRFVIRSFRWWRFHWGHGRSGFSYWIVTHYCW